MNSPCFFFLLCKIHSLLIGQGQRSPWLTNENYCGSVSAHQSRKISDTNGTTKWKEGSTEIHLQTSLVFSTVLPNQSFLLRLNTIINRQVHKRDTWLSFSFWLLSVCHIEFALVTGWILAEKSSLLSNEISLFVLFVGAGSLALARQTKYSLNLC